MSRGIARSERKPWQEDFKSPRPPKTLAGRRGFLGMSLTCHASPLLRMMTYRRLYLLLQLLFPCLLLRFLSSSSPLRQFLSSAFPFGQLYSSSSSLWPIVVAEMGGNAGLTSTMRGLTHHISQQSEAEFATACCSQSPHSATEQQGADWVSIFRHELKQNSTPPAVQNLCTARQGHNARTESRYFKII